jgi:cytochrome c-type biogenesis protein CcmF
VNVPIALVLIFLMGVGPLISWRKASKENLVKNFFVPSILGVITAAVLAILGVRDVYALLSYAMCAFVTGTVFTEFFRGVSVRSRRGENPALAFVRLVSRNKRRYGGYIVHIGVVIIVLGITSSSVFVTEKQATLTKGQSVELGGYALTYQGLEQYTTDAKNATVAKLLGFKNGKPIGDISPEKNVYKYEGNREINQETEVALRSTFTDDLYVILMTYGQDGSATIRVMVNPMVSWIWSGGVVLLIGAIVTMWPGGRKERDEVFVRYTLHGRDTTAKV